MFDWLIGGLILYILVLVSVATTFLLYDCYREWRKK